MQEQAFSLYELNVRVRDTLRDAFPHNIWVVGEISELHLNRNGHCYLELVEKNEDTDKLVAKARAIIWSYTFRMLQPYFETTAGTKFASGIKVLVKVTVEFHELYGFSLNITDVDPNYTLGDMARKKQEVIKRLEKEGVLEMNRELDIPLVVQKIAVISSKTAAGYGDFMNQLNNNPYGYVFYTRLYEAMMQGDGAEKSIIEALDKIYESEDFFDAVAIIRGGGSKADLSCFDGYWLAYNITQFSLPVLSGIGHERDDSVLDLVANTRLKTPTAVAEFIVDKASEFEYSLDECLDSFTLNIQGYLQEEHTRMAFIEKAIEASAGRRMLNETNLLGQYRQKINFLSGNYLASKSSRLEHLSGQSKATCQRRMDNAKMMLNEKQEILSHNIRQYLEKQRHKLELFDNVARYADPQKILAKGYTITTINNKVVKSIQQVKAETTVNTRVSDGVIKSIVKGIEKQK